MSYESPNGTMGRRATRRATGVAGGAPVIRRGKVHNGIKRRPGGMHVPKPKEER